MQLELFPDKPTVPPMRMVLDTKDVSLSVQSPEEAIRTISEASAALPEGSTDIYFEICGRPADLHQVCRLVFKRPQTEAERSVEVRCASHG